MGRRSTVIEELRAAQQPIINRCKKVIEDELTICSRSDGEVCRAYAFPEAKWRSQDCPLADSFLQTVAADDTPTEKVRVGQQKQKKKK
jgi:hypothetical protein